MEKIRSNTHNKSQNDILYDNFSKIILKKIRSNPHNKS